MADGKEVHEIVVFSAQLKSQDCPDDVFLFIDRNMPRHVVFVLEYEGQYKLLLNYKEWLDASAGTFKIVKSFASEWLREADLSLPIQGLTMDAIYENMAGVISGYGTSRSEETKRMVELESLIQKGRKEIAALQKRVRTERQFNRQHPNCRLGQGQGDRAPRGLGLDGTRKAARHLHHVVGHAV